MRSDRTLSSAIPTTLATATPIGFHGMYSPTPHGDLEVAVRIVDTRIRFGNTDYLIAPLAGRGEKWVPDHKVTDLSAPLPRPVLP